MQAEARPFQGEPLVWLLLHRVGLPLWVVLADDQVHWTLLLADLQVLLGNLGERLPGALRDIPLLRRRCVAHASGSDPLPAALPVQDWHHVLAAAVPGVLTLAGQLLRPSAHSQSQSHGNHVQVDRVVADGVEHHPHDGVPLGHPGPHILYARPSWLSDGVHGIQHRPVLSPPATACPPRRLHRPRPL